MKIITLNHIFTKSSAWARHSIKVCILFIIILDLFLLCTILLFLFYIFLIFRNLNLLIIFIIFIIKSINITNFNWVERGSFNCWSNLAPFFLNIYFLLNIIPQIITSICIFILSSTPFFIRFILLMN